MKPFEYTEDGCFKGELLKQPPLPADDERVKKRLTSVRTPVRRWLHYGCAVEELGRFGMWNPNHDEVEESAFVWHIYEQLAKPQPIENNDGVGAVGGTTKKDKVFEPRYVLAALVNGQLKSGVGRCLIDYFGFKLQAPLFGNAASHYGTYSRVALLGLCTTRYLAEKDQGDGRS
jgi:hypothetical protein